MEKYKIIVLVERIKKCLEEDKLKEALTLAEGIDKKKLKNMSDLCVIAECYFQNKQYEEAKRLFLKIYEKNKTRRIVAQLVHLSIKLEEAEEAEKYLNEFIHVAPRDFYRYIFRYSIDKLNHAPMAALIEDLENLKEHEYIESWAYELAKLYYKSGMKNECVKECDDIMLWFGNGEYVERAKALRAYYMGELTVENLKEKAEKAKESVHKETKKAETSPVTQDSDDISVYERALANSIELDEGAQSEEKSKPEEAKSEESESEELESEPEEAEFDDSEEAESEEYEYVDYAGDDEYYEEDDDGRENEFDEDDSTDQEELLALLRAKEVPEEDEFAKYTDNESETDDENSDEFINPSMSSDVPLRLRKKSKNKKADFPKRFGHFAKNLLKKMNLEQQDEDFDDEEEKIVEDADIQQESKEEIKQAETANDGIETDSEVNTDSIESSDTEDEIDLSESDDFEEAELSENVVIEDETEREEAAEDVDEEMEESEEIVEESEEIVEESEEIVEESEEPIEDSFSGYAPHERLKLDPPSNDELLMEADRHLRAELEERNIDLMHTFGNFMRNDSIKEQLIPAMKQMMISRNDNVNLAIMGDESDENLLFAKKMAKFIYRFGCISSKKVALISGERLNAIPILDRREQLKDSVLIIEHASAMNQETIWALMRLNAYYPNGIAVILEDTKEAVKKIFKDNASIHAIFDLQIIIPEYTFDEYMGFAYDYICAKQYEIEAEAFEELERLLLSVFNGTEENRLKTVFSCLDQIIQNSEHRNAEQLKAVSVTGHYEETDFMVIKKEDVNMD